MDTKFSVALHILSMISESSTILSSQSLAESVGTNASYIRKVIALLKKAEIISSQQGKSGYELTKSPKDLSLFPVHQNRNLNCPVGRYIEGAISPIFSDVEEELERELKNKTLKDVIDNLYQTAKDSKH